MGEGVKLATVMDALNAEAWASANDLAIRALSSGSWERQDEAYLYFARARSLSNQDQYTVALEPAQRAVTLAEQAEAWDLLGLALLELAFIQRKIEHLQHQAVETVNRYFEYFPRYGQEGRARYLPAMFALGAYLRAAGRHPEALEQFQKAYTEAVRHKETTWADRARRNAVYEALLLRQVALAESLVQSGEEYVARHTDDDMTMASHLIDQAHLALLKGDLPTAKGKAQEAILRAKKLPGMSSQALDLLHQAARSENNNTAALAMAILAKIQAEADQQVERIGELSNSIQEIALRDPEAAEQFVRDLTWTG